MLLTFCARQDCRRWPTRPPHELPDPELVSMWAIFQFKAGHRDAVESCLSIHSVTKVVMRVMAPVQGPGGGGRV